MIKYYSYTPSSAISSIYDRSGLNDNGKFYYLSAQPELNATQSFNDACTSIERTVSVLGCYLNQIIYIYDVTDQSLDGIEEVTAVHEVMHAIYERLSQPEKDKLEPLLDAEYQKIKNDPVFQDRMEYYDRAEPGEMYNELHSIIATEISDINVELEEYYAKYFYDRKVIVGLYEKYSAVFKRLEDESDVLAEKLNLLNSNIAEQVGSYNNSIILLNNDIDAFNTKADAGLFESQADFLHERQALVARVSVLNSTKNSINAMINEYNQTLVDYNNNAIETKKVYNSIDSTLAPAPSI